jgi:transposase
MTTETITSTLKLEIVKDMDREWDDLANVLHGLSTPLHRVMNRAITQLELEVVGDNLPVYKKTGKPYTKRGRAYQLVRDFWAEERAKSRGKKKPSQLDKIIAATSPHGSVLLGIGARVNTHWKKWDQNRWRGEQVLPTFRKNQPIEIASSNNAVTIDDAGSGLAIVNLRLLGTPDGGRPKRNNDGLFRLLVRPYTSAGFADLRRILADNKMLGSARVRWTKVRPKKKNRKRSEPKVWRWQVQLAWTRPVEQRTEGRVMAVRRGVNTFITAAVSRDEKREAYTTILETGDDIIQHKRRYQARRRSLGQQFRQLGRGARGHGKGRREQHYARIGDKEARWVDSKCREIAAHTVRLAERKGVATILLEDWSKPKNDGKKPDTITPAIVFYVNSMPMGKVKDMIEWAAKKKGITVEIVSGKYQSRRCPKCEHLHEETPLRRDYNGRKTIFLCDGCKLERNVDVVAAWNMLVNYGEDLPLDDAIKASKRAAGRLKKGRKAASS